MSINSTAARNNPRDTPGTEPNTNPFDTVFDGEDVDSDCWDDEETIATLSPLKAAKTVRITQWPRPPVTTAEQMTGKSVTRTSMRRPDKRCSVQKPMRDKSRGRQKKQNAKAGIKVVTNFSRHQAATPPVQLQPSQTIPSRGCFVDLAALQALSGETQQQNQSSGAFWKSKKSKNFARAANTETSPSRGVQQSSDPGISQQPAISNLDLLNKRKSKGLIPSPLKLGDDLSPSDRPIVIGISIPSADLERHALSPQTAASETSKIVQSYEYRTPTSQAPETPIIIITPAQEGSIWSPLDEKISVEDRYRPTSSVYSQATRRNDKSSDAPPLPQMPASVLEDERQRKAAEKSCFSPDSDDSTAWEDDDDTENRSIRSRVVSTSTLFEEDDSPILTKTGRAVSVSTGTTVDKHASINTVATRRRSKGWWNYITTPFLTRSNTFLTTGVIDEQPPAVPSLAVAAARARVAERDGKTWEKQFSPLTPETSSSTASDYWWNADSKHLRIEEQSPVLHETRHKVQTSKSSLPTGISETAGLVVTSVTTMPTVDQFQLRRENTTTTMHSTSGLRVSDDEIPVISDSPSARNTPTSNPFVQPGLADITDFPARQPSRPAAAFIRGVVVPPPAQSIPPPSAGPPPPYSPSPPRAIRYRAVFPPDHALGIEYPLSPGPVSPGLVHAMSSQGAIPMSTIPSHISHSSQDAPLSTVSLTPRRPINLNSGYPDLATREQGDRFTSEHIQAPSNKSQKVEAKRRRYEREEAVARRAGGCWRGRGCIPDRGCYSRSGAEGRKRRRWYLALIVGFLSMIILVVVLATTLHRKSSTVVGPSQWLNLTGFPPIYLGLSTVIAPANIVANTGCVFPATQWSCDLPKEQQAAVAPNQPSQPNFFLEIQWDNSSSTNATFANVTGNPKLGTRSTAGNPVSAGAFLRSLILKARDVVTFIPNPAPPSYSEAFFLGNTTDGIVSDQKAGEPTPFYISFLSKAGSATNKRQLLTRDEQFPNVTSIIPAPSLNFDGTAAPANLLPFDTQQPIRLYDRGLPTEHYGFYNYFDRSIFLKSLSLLNSTNANDGEVPDDENGGATESEAAFRCTWSQTRFLVQMWTRMNGTSQLLNSTSSSPTATLNPATDLTQPGSFPYPITITTDRHGGDPSLKMIYCYDMNDREGIVAGSGKINAESRGFGGAVINEAPSVFANSSNPALGGYDGGTGGCSCQWTNFLEVVRG